MFNELQPGEQHLQTNLFTGSHVQLALAAIAAGNTKGRMWQHTTNQAGLLWDQGNNVLYVAGDLAVFELRTELKQLIGSTVHEEAIHAGLARFKTVALINNSQAILHELFAGMALQPLETRLYRYAGTQPSITDLSIEGMQVVPIDAILLQRTDLADLADIREEIAWMWPSQAHFEQYGLGYAAILDQRIVCWCTSEYVSMDRCGIGIATQPAFERRGIATITAAYLVQACVERGLVPYWECRASNMGSVRVAEKLGLELVTTMVFQAGTFTS
jgi:GNAT superfamily N-acetyltransferase